MRLTKTGLLATTFIAGLVAFAPSLASAQAQQPARPAASQSPDEQDAQADSSRVEDVVVTGSRIRRNEFTSSQPIQVITAEQATLEGIVDTTELLQSSTAANTATQINNFFTGFVTTGGPGVNTVSLRGLGAQRTLVLVNGRRVGPAGVRGQVGPTDLNTIPGSLIERVEVLTDGASSIYGSDAVAGVINIITKTNLDGGNVELYAGMPFEGGGEQFRVSGSYGKAFDRGYLSAGVDYYEQRALLFGDREAFKCPEDRVYSDPDLKFRRDVLEDGEFKCDFTLNGIVRTQRAGGAAVTARQRRDGDFIFDPTAIQGGGFTGCDINGWRQVAGGFSSGTSQTTTPIATPTNNCSITAQNTALRRAAYSVYPLYNDRYESRTAISPVKRYSVSVFGGFDLTPNIEVYGEALWNRRESEQRSWRQLFPTVSPFHSQNPFGGAFNGTTQTFGSGYYATPVALVNSNSDQQVDYIRGVGGFRGSFGALGKTWDWDLAAQYSKSDGKYGGNFFYNDRVEATAGYYALFGADARGNTIGAARTFGASTGNCDTAILISATACPTGGISWFSPDFLTNGVLPAGQMEFLQGYEQGQTEYIHQYVEGSISGELFNLPAGPIGAALGFQIRKEEIDDQPGAEQQRNNLWGSTAAGRTKGSDTIKEAFLELELPILRDLPFFDRLTANLSGRISDYDSYGTSDTYKVGLNWQINSQFRIRSSYGTSFRAPALYELFLANQTSFLGQANVDPCRNWGTSTNQRLQQNCAADGVPATYNDPGSSALIVTGGGAGILEPETADALSVGLIWTPSFVDLSIAVDYFDITVNDQVAQFGSANILSACYNSENYPNEALCTLFTRDKNPASARFNQILTINDSYVNISEQQSKGLDINARYRKELAIGDFQVNLRVSHILDWTQQVFNASAPTVLNSRIGSPETVGNLGFRFDRGDWTVFYGINYVGEASNQFLFPAAANANGATTFLGENVYVNRSVDPYLTHTVSVRKRMDKWTLQMGIQNLFDENPPYLGLSSGASVIGNTPLASQYDWNQRTGFINISRTF